MPRTFAPLPGSTSLRTPRGGANLREITTMRRNLGWTLGGVLVLAACSRGAGDGARAAVEASVVTASDAAPAAAAIEVADRSSNVQALAEPAATAPAVERMIVRSATMAMQVANVRETADAVARATEAAHGFLGASRRWGSGDEERASLTLRVPAAALDSTMAALRGMAVRVENEAVSGEDVTRQAVDLRAQLVNLRATEVELRALLTTVRQSARKASDVLEVHGELSRVRGEIERADAELQGLTQLAALSTISLELRPDVVAAPIASDGWQPRGVLHDATRALVSTLRVGVNGAIWAAVYVLPIALLVGVPLWLLRRQLRMRRRPTTV